jgi:hypothetical protein
LINLTAASRCSNWLLQIEKQLVYFWQRTTLCS